MVKHPKLLDKFSKRVQLTLKARDPKFLEQNGNVLEDFIFSEKKIDDRRVIN